MQPEEILVKIIFNNQMAFCGIFGALGGIAHILDVNTKLSLNIVLSKIVVSTIAGLLLFFVTYEFEKISPSFRIAAAILSGFYGTLLFKILSRFYIKQLTFNGEMTDDGEKNN